MIKKPIETLLEELRELEGRSVTAVLALVVYQDEGVEQCRERLHCSSASSAAFLADVASGVIDKIDDSMSDPLAWLMN